MDFHIELANGGKISLNEALNFYQNYISFEIIVESTPLKTRKYFGYCTDINLSIAKPHFCSITANLPHYGAAEKIFSFNHIKSIQLIDITKYDDASFSTQT